MKQTLDAYYDEQNKNIYFKTTHLSKYGIIAKKIEEDKTTTKLITTKIQTTNSSKVNTSSTNSTTTNNKKTTINSPQTNTSNTISTTTTSTTKKQYDTTITLYFDDGTNKQFIINSGETKSFKYYYARGNMPNKINVTGNSSYTYIISPKNSSKKFNVPITYENYSGNNDYFYIENDQGRYFEISHYNETNERIYVGNIEIYEVYVYLGSTKSYPLSDGWTHNITIDQSYELGIYGKNFDKVSCTSSAPQKLIIDNVNNKLKYYATEKGNYTITCKANNLPSASTWINIIAN